MAGKGGGAWKVAYADFVTAMMAFFMVMWLISQSEKVKEAVAKHFREPPANGQLLPPLVELFPKEGLSPEREKHAQRMIGNPVDSTPNPDFATERGERTRIGTVILFDESSADLTSEGQKKLDELVPLLAGKPQKIELRGHATSRPLPPDKPFQDAWQLCYARSLAVMHYLEKQGIPPERVRLSLAGPFEPFTISADADKMRRNSCVEVYLLAELTSNLFGTEAEREARFVEDEPAEHETGHAAEHPVAHYVNQPATEAASHSSHESTQQPTKQPTKSSSKQSTKHSTKKKSTKSQTKKSSGSHH